MLMENLYSYLSQIDVKTCVLAASAISALYSIHRNTTINRRRATVDLVLHQKNDEDLKTSNQIVNPLIHSQNITKFAAKEHARSDETKAILMVLNNYEFIATGIREKAFDFNLYKLRFFAIFCLVISASPTLIIGSYTD
ncbi:DUF4760 domain-containing protein [Marinomonas agarivorans]|nr:DUF4760 domain-containing protein [Marinomonas agarivorans]